MSRVKLPYAENECPICADNSGDRCGVFAQSDDHSNISSFSCKTKVDNDPLFKWLSSSHHFQKYMLRQPMTAAEKDMVESSLSGQVVLLGGGGGNNTFLAGKGTKAFGAAQQNMENVNYYNVEDRDRLYRSIHSKLGRRPGSVFYKNITKRLPTEEALAAYTQLFIDPHCIMGWENLLSPLTAEEKTFIDDTFPRPLRDAFQQKSTQKIAPYGLIPMFSPEGLVHGWQQMAVYPNKTRAKYLHASSTSTAINGKVTINRIKVSDGVTELPITTLTANSPCNTVYIMEGVLKPNIFYAQQLGKVHVIGAAGGQAATSPCLLGRSLTYLRGLGVSRVVIMPDKNWLDVDKKLNVISAMSSALKFAQDLGFETFVAEFGQMDGLVNDPDELPSLVSGLGSNARSGHSENAINKVLLSTVFNSPKRFDVVDTKGVKAEASHEIPADDVLACRNALLANKGKVIIDKRPLGAGKSTSVHDLATNTGHKVIYVSASPRTVGSEKVYAAATQVIGRHNGLFLQEGRVDALGEPLVLTVPSKTEVVPPNCAIPSAFTSAHNSGIAGYEVCQKCKFFAECNSGTNLDGYDYLHKRKKALESQFISTTVASLPFSVCDENAYVFFDEASTLFAPKTTQYSRVGARLATQLVGEKFPELGFTLTIGANGLPQANWDRKKYSEEQMMGCLVAVDMGAVKSAAGALHRGTSSASFVRIANLVKDLISGTAKITLSNLSIDVVSQSSPVPHLLEKGATVVLLDATCDTAILAAKAGVECGSVIELTGQDKSADNCSIRVYRTAGFNQASNKAAREERLPYYRQALSAIAPKTGFITHKAYAQDGDGIYFSSSRGSNAFADLDQLVLVGLPIYNLSHLALEYEVLGNAIPYTLDEYCNLTAQAEIKQAIGRIRAHRRSGLDLTVAVIGNYDLGFLTAEGWSVSHHLAEHSLLAPEVAEQVATSTELRQLLYLRKICEAVKSGASTVADIAIKLATRSTSIQRALQRAGLCLSAIQQLFASNPVYGNWQQAPDFISPDVVPDLSKLELEEVCWVIKHFSTNTWYQGFNRQQMLKLYQGVKLQLVYNNWSDAWKQIETCLDSLPLTTEWTLDVGDWQNGLVNLIKNCHYTPSANNKLSKSVTRLREDIAEALNLPDQLAWLFGKGGLLPNELAMV